MNTQHRKEQVKRLIRDIRNRNPFKISRTSNGIALTREGYEYDPDKEERAILVVIDGKHTTTKEVRKEADDMALHFDGNDKTAAITSEPLLVGNTQFYFTRPGFLGTIALNEDTLLDGDIYKRSNSQKKREIPKDVIDNNEENIDWDNLSVDPSDLEETDSGDAYLVPTAEVGDVVGLFGSKATLNRMTEAKLLRRLLTLKDISWRKKLIYMGLGAGAGWIAQQQWG